MTHPRVTKSDDPPPLSIFPRASRGQSVASHVEVRCAKGLGGASNYGQFLRTEGVNRAQTGGRNRLIVQRDGCSEYPKKDG